MRIVKHHKSRSQHSEQFGIWSGKTLANIPVGKHDHHVTHGGLSDKIEHVKVGSLSHDAFLWFDDMEELRSLGEKLISIADEAARRQQNAE